MTSEPTAAVIAAREVQLDGDAGQVVTVTVVSVEHHEEGGIDGSPVIGLQAELEVLYPGDSGPHYISVSRLVDEVRWLQDAHFGPGSYPYFVNGFGARYTIPRPLRDELAAVVNEAARERGLAAELGPQTLAALAGRLEQLPSAAALAAIAVLAGAERAGLSREVEMDGPVTAIVDLLANLRALVPELGHDYDELDLRALGHHQAECKEKEEQEG